MKLLSLAFAFLMISCLFLAFKSEPIKTLTNPMEKVGIEHNKVVKNLLPKITQKGWSKTQAIEEVIKWGKDNGDTFHNSSRNYTDPYALLKEYNLPSDLEVEVKSLIDALSKSKDYSEVENLVNVRLSSVSSKFSGKELEAIQSYLAVVKYSSKLWLPKEAGGEDALSTLIISEPIGGGSPNMVINWWKVAACDGVGAIGGGIMGGWVGAGVGAGVASICSGINQY